MDRKQKILRHVDKNGYGIEVGPSYNPVTPKSDNYNVQVIDHLNREQLIEKYKVHNVNIDAIEEVDFVWKGESFSELTGVSKHYDWIIASHIIEHTPDLIGFLNDCDLILKDDGMLSLVVPDKRCMFDYFRPITGISKIIDNHLLKKKKHTPGTLAESFLNVVKKSDKIVWDLNTDGKYSLFHTLEEAVEHSKSAINNDDYVDTHAWCFVPHSFRLIINDLFHLGYIPFKEVCFYQTAGCEFFITLSRTGQGIGMSRREMLTIIDSEIMEGICQEKKHKASNSKFKKIIKRLLKK